MRTVRPVVFDTHGGYLLGYTQKKWEQWCSQFGDLMPNNDEVVCDNRSHAVKEGFLRGPQHPEWNRNLDARTWARAHRLGEDAVFIHVPDTYWRTAGTVFVRVRGQGWNSLPITDDEERFWDTQTSHPLAQGAWPITAWEATYLGVSSE